MFRLQIVKSKFESKSEVNAINLTSDFAKRFVSGPTTIVDLFEFYDDARTYKP
jgi:hypothetical protein